MKIGFRPLTADDLELLHEWLQREHVRRWWNERETYEEVAAHYLPAIEGKKPTDLYLILLDQRPAGFIQTYLVSDYAEYRELVGVGEGVAGVDLFLADSEVIGQGIGSRVLSDFVRTVVFGAPTTHACVADPDVDNLASIRAFEKAGFHKVNEFVDSGDNNRLHALLRIDR